MMMMMMKQASFVVASGQKGCVASRFRGKSRRYGDSVRLSCGKSVNIFVSPGERDQPSSEGEVGAIDAIYVLAGGQTRDGAVPPWVGKRLEAAACRWKSIKKECNIPIPIVTLGAGSPHALPVFNRFGQVKFESTSCAEILVGLGVEAKCIFKESSSYDTIGNVYFSLVNFSIPREWHRVAVYTNDFHFERTKAIYEWIYNVKGSGAFVMSLGLLPHIHIHISV